MNPDNCYAVAVFGIPEFEQELVRRIFAVSESRENVYRIVEETQVDSAAIALVDMNGADATDHYERFHAQRQNFPTVLVVNGRDHGCEYWVKRPFTVTRMLGALDRLVDEKISGSDRSQPGAGGSSQLGEPVEESSAPGAYKALVVDDSRPVRQQLSVALRRAGVSAEFAATGESALQLIETHRYDIIILDIMLPGIDGYEVCKKLKADRSTQQIPVVILTAKSSPSDRVKGEVAGCDAYMTKPVSLDEFNKTLSEFLKPPPSLQSAATAT